MSSSGFSWVHKLMRESLQPTIPVEDPCIFNCRRSVVVLLWWAQTSSSYDRPLLLKREWWMLLKCRLKCVRTSGARVYKHNNESRTNSARVPRTRIPLQWCKNEDSPVSARSHAANRPAHGPAGSGGGGASCATNQRHPPLNDLFPCAAWGTIKNRNKKNTCGGNYRPDSKWSKIKECFISQLILQRALLF